MPDIVPDKLTEKINFKILILGFSFILIFQIITMQFSTHENTDLFVMIASLIGTSTVALVSFFISGRYGLRTHVFGKSYFALGLGFLSYTIGEFLYYALEIFFQYDAYPSIADIFFLGYYVGALIHLILNLKFFRSMTNKKIIAGVIIFPIIAIAGFSSISISSLDEMNFDFFYGMLFIVPATVIFPIALLTTHTMYRGVVGSVWILITLGIALTMGADLIYYYLEIFDEYNTVHPINVLWWFSEFLMCYALIKHKNAI